MPRARFTITRLTAPPLAGREGILTGSLDDIANELFSLIAEIAVEKARRAGLAMVHDELSDLVCSIEFQPPHQTITFRLPATCNLIRTTDLEALVGQGRALRAALTSDLLAAARTYAAAQLASIPPLASGAQAGILLIGRLAADPQAHLSQK